MMNADEMTGYPSIDKPWLKYYSKEFINKPLKKCTVYQNVYTSNSEHMSDIALIYFNNKISYRTLFREVDRCAYSLKCMGIQSGDIISLCTAETPESIYLLLAANKLGAVCNFVNPFLQKNNYYRELTRHIVKFCLYWTVFINRFNLLLISLILEK